MPAVPTRAHSLVVAGDDQPRVAIVERREGAQQQIDALARREAAEVEHELRSPIPCSRRKLSALGKTLVLVAVDRIADHLDRARIEAERHQLATLRLAHRLVRGGAAPVAAAHGQIVDPLEQPAALDPRRGAVRSDHVGNAGAAQAARRQGHRKVAAGVQMSDVEVAGAARQPGCEPARQEELQMVGGRVREVGEHLDFDRDSRAAPLVLVGERGSRRRAHRWCRL